LAIFANGGGLTGGHAWITYTPDSSKVTTSYGTWGNEAVGKGLMINAELNLGMTSADASKSMHLNDAQEAKLFGVIQDYWKRGDDGWLILAPCSAFAQDGVTAEFGGNSTLRLKSQ
jgi:hypothetical protein